VSSSSNYTLLKIQTSHSSRHFSLDEGFEVKSYQVTYQQTLHKVSKRSPSTDTKVGRTLLEQIKYIVKRIISMYYTYKPEVHLITCVAEHFYIRIHTLFQQQGDQEVGAPINTGSRLADNSYNILHIKNLLVKILEITSNSSAYSGDDTTGRNIALLEAIIYQVAHECLMAAVDLVPGLATLLYGIYSVWNWSMEVTELVNSDKLILCIRKFTEKKFWDWIQADKYE